ncbi:MAG: methionine--tRNA ligase [Bdellovibrionales bacterium]|nr:methionine--tRNA ligase [Bdellovibrionales bacterium]
MSSKNKRVLVTSGLPYSNGRLHVGHIAGAYLPADIYVRYLRLTGREVSFVCGSDDHGVAIMLTADKEGKTPAEVAQHYHRLQKADFEGLGIHFDVYGSTSQTKFHAKTSQNFFLKLFEKNCFEKKVTRQHYDETKQVFLPDRYVKGTCSFCDTPNQNGDQCENCGKVLDIETLKNPISVLSGKPASVRETTHWFLDLTQFQGAVERWLEKAEMRDTTKNYVRSLLSQGLVKRSMTRDISWGIPVPLDDPDAKGKVLYVWFDAPIGYISNTMQLCETRGENPEQYADWWKSPDTEIIHFIGEDNTIFHCVIWIAMLSAEGSFQLPKAVVVNQFLNIKFPDKEVEKISKSRGTAVWIGDYLAEGGNPDVLRYYLTAIAPEKARTVYKPEDLQLRNNTDLANTLGNFVNRVLSFTLKHVGNEVPAVDQSKIADADKSFVLRFEVTQLAVTGQISDYNFKNALELVMEFARECNRYVDEKAPWVTRKTDMETTKVTLCCGLNAIKLLGTLLAPFLPFAAAQINKALSIEDPKWADASRPLDPGTPIHSPGILFTKVE